MIIKNEVGGRDVYVHKSVGSFIADDNDQVTDI